MSAPEIFIDFETRSEADLKKVGAWEYSLHPSTEIICLGWLDKDTSWVRYGDYLWDQIDVSESTLVIAHNAGFERAVWENIGVLQYGWPEIAPGDWRCTASVSRANGYPGKLEDAALAMGLTEQKDTEGAALMRKMSQPLAAWRRTGRSPKWHETPEDLKRLGEYCLQDVKTTKAIHDKLGFLDADELAIWQLDQKINVRGIAVDREFVQAACEVADTLAVQARERIQQLTDGAIQAPSQTEVVRKWLGAPNCQKETLEALLPTVTDPIAREIIDLRISDSRAAIKKYYAFRHRTTISNRSRDGLVYYGAHTGRWSGQGDQKHNLKRPEYIRIVVETIIIPAVLKRQIAYLEMLFGDIAKPLASCIRSALVADPGKELICADYKSIEAVLLLWLAGDDESLQVFRDGKDIYKRTASLVYSKPYSEITKEERYIGKIVCLGLGYGMGAERFVFYAKDQWGIEIDELFAVKTVKAWRARNPKITGLWKQLNTAAMRAVQQPGRVFSGSPGGRVQFRCWSGTLEMRLPSGRVVKYNQVKLVQGKYGLALSYLSNKGARVETYGGKLAENAIQAISRDVTAKGAQAVEKAGYPVVLTAHDEIVSEVPIGFGSVAEFCQLICEQPIWAVGCPISAEGWRGERYRK